MDDRILVINCGSSSLKAALFSRNHHLVASALAERLNQPDARASIAGMQVDIQLTDGAGHEQALGALVDHFRSEGLLSGAPLAIGHRVVHGGETFREAALINPGTVSAIEACSALAPLHNPVNLVGIRAMQALFPNVPQVAVFDTAFHQSLPAHAYRYALPESCYQDWGVRRYGFHGTSHAYMVEQAALRLGKSTDDTSIISAHLGNGCSITAIHRGKSVDTSMGLTPLEGLVMGTRSGDIDPGLFDYLADRGMPAADVHRMLNRDSGLLGLSGKTNDMRTLCKLADEGHGPSRLAIDVFCFRLARYIGAMTASLPSLDALVFTGGIGENSARIREQTLSHLKLLGLSLDPQRNSRHGRNNEGFVQDTNSRFAVLVIPTNEELVIARETLRLSQRSD